MAIFDEKMAVGKSENLVTLHPHNLTQPSGQEIWGGCLNLAWRTCRECWKVTVLNILRIDLYVLALGAFASGLGHNAL